ncbi:MAG: hypothetical protein FWC26_04735 [Fibromonadales bacterium]|nr:hypothetical protein [Fibromonadales bacterium]
MNVLRNTWKKLGISLVLLLLASCASKPQTHGYFEGDKQQALPDSAKVKATLSVSREEVNEKLSAVLFAVPNKKYRLELSGTFGLSAASILWKDGSWKIVFPQNERYMEGVGDCVSLPGYGDVDIHKFAILFLGRRVDTFDCSNWNVFKLEYIENAVLVSSGSDSLKIEIKNIDSKPQWSSGVWSLNVPEKYERLVR